jgi:hypothetical protein
MSEAMRDWGAALFGSRGQQQAKPATAETGGWHSRLFGSRTVNKPTMPMSRGGARNKGEFQFSRGDFRGNIQKLLTKAESPDYVTAAGGKKVPEIKRMTVEQIGSRFGNKALGRYQIQYETAIDALNRANIDPSSYVFDEAGQDRIFDLLLTQRGKINDYKAGKIGKEKVAYNLSTIWAGLPKDQSGKSRYEGVGDNKAHVAWNDVLRALD